MPRPIMSYTGRQCPACLRVEKSEWVPCRVCECGYSWVDAPTDMAVNPRTGTWTSPILDVCEMVAHEENRIRTEDSMTRRQREAAADAAYTRQQKRADLDEEHRQECQDIECQHEAHDEDADRC